MEHRILRNGALTMFGALTFAAMLLRPTLAVADPTTAIIRGQMRVVTAAIHQETRQSLRVAVIPVSVPRPLQTDR